MSSQLRFIARRLHPSSVMPERPELVRSIGRWSLAALVLNGIIGSGVFVQPGTEVLDAAIGACGQLLAACDVIRGRPSEARPMARLRLAEDTLAEARHRIQARLVASATVPQNPVYSALADEMANADTTLAFARRQFNEASQNYNDALDQFPTWVIAGLFGFRGAGSL